MNGPTKRVLVDCDTGIDDAMAILYLLGTPGVDVVALTTVFGNISAATAAANCLRLLELTGRTDIPVSIGAERTVTGETPVLAPHVHGEDGAGNTALPAPTVQPSELTAAEQIARQARRHAGELTLLAVGPLTNLAAALASEPKLDQLVRRVVVMGGAAEVAGNQTAAAEANILHDPEAASAVLNARWDCVLVPLDVTMRELLTEEHRARLEKAATPVSSLVARITDHYFDYFKAESFDRRCSPCHDALAAAIAVGDYQPTLAPRVPVEVECGAGPARGATICDTRSRYRGFAGAPAGRTQVVLRTPGVFADQLVDRLTAWPFPGRPELGH
ncbi:MAG: nucleoside hydrolase [Bifidobacteriaceae bacterium]|jgi:purine nucleosidase|nr:nucleoside hydrolase [Bifidobacteriaceae bacterium]